MVNAWELIQKKSKYSNRKKYKLKLIRFILAFTKWYDFVVVVTVTNFDILSK